MESCVRNKIIDGIVIEVIKSLIITKKNGIWNCENDAKPSAKIVFKNIPVKNEEVIFLWLFAKNIYNYHKSTKVIERVISRLKDFGIILNRTFGSSTNVVCHSINLKLTPIGIKNLNKNDEDISSISDLELETK